MTASFEPGNMALEPRKLVFRPALTAHKPAQLDFMRDLLLVAARNAEKFRQITNEPNFTQPLDRANSHIPGDLLEFSQSTGLGFVCFPFGLESASPGLRSAFRLPSPPLPHQALPHQTKISHPQGTLAFTPTPILLNTDRSSSTATDRCNNSTLTTMRHSSRCSRMIPSTPLSGPCPIRTRLPARRNGHGCSGNFEFTSVRMVEISSSGTAVAVPNPMIALTPATRSNGTRRPGYTNRANTYPGNSGESSTFTRSDQTRLSLYVGRKASTSSTVVSPSKTRNSCCGLTATAYHAGTFISVDVISISNPAGISVSTAGISVSTKDNNGAGV